MRAISILLCFLCVTVYLKDGTHVHYDEATQIATDTGTYKIISEYRILRSDKFVLVGEGSTEVVATVPAESVRYITNECSK